MKRLILGFLAIAAALAVNGQTPELEPGKLDRRKPEVDLTLPDSLRHQRQWINLTPQGVEVAVGIGTPVPGLTVGDAQASPAQAVGHPIHPHPYRMGQVFLLLAHERGHRHDGFEPQRFDARTLSFPMPR